MRSTTKMAISPSPTASNPLSRNLSYTNSLDPGEDSQLNALAMVDKLVDFGADLPWQTPKQSKEAEQASVKGSQSVKGVQVLAQSADAKNRQSCFGVFDWIDSQSNDTERDSSIIFIQGECINKQKENQTVESRPMQSSKAQNIVNNEPRDLDAQHGREETCKAEIGPNTQVALEAIDILMHGSPGSFLCGKEESFSVTDLGTNTQTALDAINILRHGIEPNTNREREEECKDMRNANQGDCNENVNDVQSKASLWGTPSGRKRSMPPTSGVGIKPFGKKGMRSRASEVSEKRVKKSFVKVCSPDFDRKERLLFDFSSLVVPRQKRSRLHSPRVLGNKNPDFLGCQESQHVSTLDGVKQHKTERHNSVNNTEAPGWRESTHNSTLTGVKQEKADRGTLVNNPQALGKQESGHNSTPESVKQDKAETGKLVNNTQLTVSTYFRRAKKYSSTLTDCPILLEEGRKKRKCESKSVFVLFSHGLSEATIDEQKKILKKLGGHVATSAAKATHFIADYFVRSRNMLEFMAAGKAVVTTNWLEGCSQAQYFVHEETYILKDAQKEKEWGFCMHSSLAASRRRPLLKGMTVAVSPNTVPDFTAIKSIIESGGGQVLQTSTFECLSIDNEKASISFVLASEEDSDCCAQYLRHGLRVFSTELLLHGVVTQSFDFSRNRLFVD